ncbi:DUF3822 family protein [Echinicola marina]|uniref:DUF3822 family protein n=1 Tax=Echinicola marina TaxID=2859768 RepID=UPI001CF6DCF8|nr:DUF3822 family protein [Echinicola marina]UCS95510.1 DUF3822 family protein [Echinicola marina]
MTKSIKNTLVEFYSDKLDVALTSSLSLLLCAENFTIMAKNQNGSILGVNSYTLDSEESIDQIINSDNFIQALPKDAESRLFVYNEKFCLVPGMLFSPKEQHTYLSFSAELLDQEVYYDGLENNKTILVGSIDLAIAKKLKQKLPNLKISHGSALILDYLLLEKSEMLNQEISIVIEKDQVYIAGFANKELKLFNRFEVIDNQDFLKYTFSVLHQLAFDRMHCKTTIIGNLEDVHVQEEVLKQYFKNLVITAPRTNLNYLAGAESYKDTKRLAAFWAN